MLYLAMDTAKCLASLEGGESARGQCYGVLLSQLSISIFLLVTMVVKVIIIPLSTAELSGDDLVRLDISRRLRWMRRRLERSDCKINIPPPCRTNTFCPSLVDSNY